MRDRRQFTTLAYTVIACMLLLACGLSGAGEATTEWHTPSKATTEAGASPLASIEAPTVLPPTTIIQATDGTPEDNAGSTPAPTSASDDQAPNTAPTLINPVEGSRVVVPTFDWQPVTGAAGYRLEVSADQTFNQIDYDYTTLQTRLTPKKAIVNGSLYWRVQVISADGSRGPFSAPWQFTKDIDAPQLVRPVAGDTVIFPQFEWNEVEGAVAYQVDISADPTFNQVDDTYTTYATQLTPKDAIAMGQLHWRVRGLDARDHPGAFSSPGAFYKTIPAPLPVAPADGGSTSLPTLAWQPAPGAAAYQIELSTDPAFNRIERTLVTGNTRLTPKKALPLGTWYWRLRAVDARKQLGETSTAVSFVLTADPFPAFPFAPSDDAVLANDPTFTWSPVPGADHYRIAVHTQPTFDKGYDVVKTNYPSYTPYAEGGDRAVFANGTYYWQVEARDKNNHLLYTSDALSFSKQAPLSLLTPEDGFAAAVTPTFGWAEVTGAASYRQMVHTQPTFDKGYDVIETEYPIYTPYGEGGDRITYADGAYYWMVEARSPSNQVICSSKARQVVRQTPVELLQPEDGAAVDTVPTFAWQPVLGARSYQLTVATDSEFKKTYDNVQTEYPTYTPYKEGGDRDTWQPGVYYWQVEARNKHGQLICTSPARQFTR